MDKTGNSRKSPEAIATLRFFFCGQGDTILIEAVPGRWGLVDCYLTKTSGARSRIRTLIEEKEISRLEFVCLTHPHPDHYYKMRELLEDKFYDRTLEVPRFAEF